MPAKNSIKQYLENGYYHIYNRGVEKRDIFLDKQDHSVFLSYLKEYLLPKDEKKLMDQLSKTDITYQEKDRIIKALRMNNFSDQISLLAYCLMPNHYHFLLKQLEYNSIDHFLRSIGTRYSMYFNRKYKRVGPLYQGVYKAVLVSRDEQLLHVSRYIHKQGIDLKEISLQKQEKQPSSYGDYVGLRKTLWVKKEEILSYFNKNSKNSSYQSFVKETSDLEVVSKLLIELD